MKKYFEALPPIKRKKFDVKKFMKLANELEESVPQSEFDNWRDMKIEEKIEWLKDRVDEILREKK